LVLELTFNEQVDGTGNVGHLLRDACLPNLRILHLSGMNCRVPELRRFLGAHPCLEELALAKMMLSHAWTPSRLPCDALPDLRYLECSSAQAVALTKNFEISSRRPETLFGVEVHDAVVNSRYLSWDDDWEDEGHDDADGEAPSPWKALFLGVLKAQDSVTRLGVVSIGTPQEMEALSAVVPQVREFDICSAQDLKIPVSLNCSYLSPATGNAY
jgi:hypothetical protein